MDAACAKALEVDLIAVGRIASMLTKRGAIHRTGCANTAGAAAQTTKPLGFSGKGTFDAINVALTVVALSPMVNVKSLIHRARHVYAGCIGALYAQAGIIAADDSCESEFGDNLRTVAASWDETVLAEGLGCSLRLDSPSRKRPSCHTSRPQFHLQCNLAVILVRDGRSSRWTAPQSPSSATWWINASPGL